MNVCGYYVAWVGACKTPCAVGEFCREHTKKCACGAPAAMECEREIMSMCCGAALCGACLESHNKGHDEANRSRITYTLKLNEKELRWLIKRCRHVVPTSIQNKLREQQMLMDKWAK